MKIIPAIFLMGLLFSGAMVYSQDNVKETRTGLKVTGSEDIFKRGIWNFTLDQSFSNWSGNNVQSSGNADFFEHSTQIEANYFLFNHFAVGAGFGYGFDKSSDMDIYPAWIERTTTIDGKINFIFGTHFGGNFNFITKATVGLGKEKINHNGEYLAYDENNWSYSAGLFIGTPIKLDRNIYFTPLAGYEYRDQWGDSYEQRKGFSLALNMDFYMGCGDDRCDLGKDRPALADRYRQGEVHLGSRMFGGFRFGDKKSSLDPDAYGWHEGEVSSSSLSGYALIYVIDNLGIGIGANLWCNREKWLLSDEIGEVSDRELEYTISLMTRYHLPFSNMLKNIYAEFNFGLGSYIDKTISEPETYTNKTLVSDFKLGLGYEYYISEHFSLSPTAGLAGHHLRDAYNEGSKIGFYAGIGWNFHL